MFYNTILKHTLGIEPNGSYNNPAPAEQWPLSLNAFQYGARGGTRTRMAITAGGF